MKDYKEAYSFFDFDNNLSLVNGQIALNDPTKESALANAMVMLEETKHEEAVEHLDQGAVEHLLEHFEVAQEDAGEVLEKFAEMDYLIKLLASNPTDRSPLTMLLLADLTPSKQDDKETAKLLLQHFIQKYSFVLKQLQSINARLN
ncbi:MAG TPA: hypothetical protein VM577_13175 [Anaerovoracaceae bacterium]|nr:hypothetical protein [Anaerovoracaceae bacterium]